jgi:hypothetical protein
MFSIDIGTDLPYGCGFGERQGRGVEAVTGTPNRFRTPGFGRAM